MPMVQTARKRDPLKKALKLDALRKKQDAIRAKIAKIEAREKAAAQRAETRLRLILGTAVLANVNQYPETRAGIVDILEKTVCARRDRDFLKARNWL